MGHHYRIILCIMLCAILATTSAGCKKLPEPYTSENLSGEMEYISGVWVLNDELNMYEQTFEDYIAENRFTDVYFTCNGKEYRRIFWYYSETGTASLKGLSYRELNEKKPEREWSYCVYQEGHSSIPQTGWQSEKYKTIDFGSEQQSVNKEFYDWLIRNATPIS